MKIKFLFPILFLIHVPAFASKECSWAIQVHKDEPYRIDVRNADSDRRRKRIEDIKQAITTTHTPLTEAWAASAATNTEILRLLNTSEKAIFMAKKVLRGAIATNGRVAALLENASTFSTSQVEDYQLSNYLRDIVNRTPLAFDDRNTLQQIIAGISSVEDSMKFFKTKEDGLKAVLDSETTFTGQLLTELDFYRQQLKSEIKSYENDVKNNNSALEREVARRDHQQKELDAHKAAIDANEQANARSREYMKRWDVNAYCNPNPSPPGNSGSQSVML